MKLSIKVTEHEAIMTREKWGVLAYVLFGDAVCIALGSVFCFLAYSKTWVPETFPFLFGCAFILLAVSHLIFELPKLVKKTMADDGLRVLIANTDGLTLNNVIGCQPRFYKWDDITEIVLASELKTIETDESSYTWNTIIVTFAPECHAGKSFLQRANAGISTASNGKSYTLANFTPDLKDELLNAFQHYLRRPNIVKYFKKAIFDIKGDAVISDATT